MSAVRIDLNRIDISLHGVSGDLAREALEGLEEEISRQLQGVRIADRPVTVNGISLKPQQVASPLDAGAMRTLVAGQIALAVRQGGAS